MSLEMEDHIQELRNRKAIAAGTPEEAERQHKKGRLTARERIEILFDPGTFEEIDALALPRHESYLGGKKSRYGDGVVAGFGLINGRHVTRSCPSWYGPYPAWTTRRSSGLG